MSLPIRRVADAPFGSRFTPIGPSRGEWTGFVSVALVLRRLYLICDDATAVSRMAFQ